MVQANSEAPGRGDGVEPTICQVCSEPLVSGEFTPLLGHFMICDDCVIEASTQVLAVVQRRLLSAAVQYVVLGKDMKPIAILDSDELDELTKPQEKSRGATVHPIRP